MNWHLTAGEQAADVAFWAPREKSFSTGLVCSALFMLLCAQMYMSLITHACNKCAGISPPCKCLTYCYTSQQYRRIYGFDAVIGDRQYQDRSILLSVIGDRWSAPKILITASLLESGSSLLLRLGDTPLWEAKMAVLKTPPPGTAVCSVGSLSLAVVVLWRLFYQLFWFPSPFVLGRRNWCVVHWVNMLEVNSLTFDLLRQNPSVLKRFLRSQKMLKLSIKFTEWAAHAGLSHLLNINNLLKVNKGNF